MLKPIFVPGFQADKSESAWRKRPGALSVRRLPLQSGGKASASIVEDLGLNPAFPVGFSRGLFPWAFPGRVIPVTGGYHTGRMTLSGQH